MKYTLCLHNPTRAYINATALLVFPLSLSKRLLHSPKPAPWDVFSISIC